MASSKLCIQRLFKTATQQGGFFTTKQAKQARYQDAVHPYHVRNGDWESVRRGIYRLALYPAHSRAFFITWSLWSRDRSDIPQGVYSHETALFLHGLLDLPLPDSLHMTVPARFRKGTAIPGHLILHRSTLRQNEAVSAEGYAYTSLERTVRDLQVAGVDAGLLASITDPDVTLRLKAAPEKPEITLADEFDKSEYEPAPAVKGEEEAPSWAAWDE